MEKQTISFRQAVCILVVFVVGNSAITGGVTELEQDSWVALVLSQVFVLPILFVYARIIQLYPQLNLYEIIQIIFGSFFGKIITALFTWYAFHLSSIVIRNFTVFFQITSLTETPLVIITLILVFVSVYLTRSGVKILGRWALIVFVIYCAIILSTFAILTADMDISSMMPFLSHNTINLFSGAYKLFTFPFAESVLFLAIADSIRKQDNPYKFYFGGVLFGGLLLLLILLRNILTLGPFLNKSYLYPSYNVIRVIDIMNSFFRTEEFIAVNFVLGGITKISVCFLAAAKGLSSLFHLKDPLKLVMPIGLSSGALSCILFPDAMAMFNFWTIYQVYVIPFQIILPVLIWLGGEIKTRFSKKQNEMEQSSS